MSSAFNKSLCAAIVFAAVQQCGCWCGVSQQTEVSFPEKLPEDIPTVEEQLTRLDPREFRAEDMRPIARPDFTMSAAALAEEFAADKKAAKEKYAFKSIRADGRVIEVGQDKAGVPFVVLEGVKATPVSIGFPASQSVYVERIELNDHVVLQGNFTAFLSESEVSLYDGGIVSYEK